MPPFEIGGWVSDCEDSLQRQPLSERRHLARGVFYVRYAVSYRDLEEIMAECGVAVDHATLNRWVIKYAPLIAKEEHKRKQKTAVSWRIDETYIRVKGKWTYYYRAVDKFGKTLDFMFSERRDETAATAFFTRAIGNNGFPDKVVIDKSGANLAGLQNMNCLLILNGWYWLIDILQVKYLNNIIEQDRRFIKKLTRQIYFCGPVGKLHLRCPEPSPSGRKGIALTNEIANSLTGQVADQTAGGPSSTLTVIDAFIARRRGRKCCCC